MKPIFYRITRPIIKFLFNVIYRPKIKNENFIPKEGKIIFAGNHTNNLDCIFLISIDKRTIHFLAKHTLLQGIKGPIFKAMGIIPVDRTKEKNTKATAIATEILNEGGVIGIFPEGTINRTNDVIMPFKMGAVSLAKKTDSWIVPFTIKGKYRPFKNELSIEFSKAYKCVNENLENENKKLMKIVKDMLERK